MTEKSFTIGGCELRLTDVLDQHYHNYDFIFLENANFDYVTCKLDVYVKDQNWLIAFQKMGISKGGPETWIYYYSNLNPENYGFVDCENIELNKNSSNPLFEGTITVNEDVTLYSLNENDYTENNISILDQCYIDTYLLRALNEHYPDSINWFMPSDKVLKTINETSGWVSFYSTECWEHVEVESEAPSENPFFISLERAIIEKNIALVEQGSGNTHWSNWTEYDFDKQNDWETDFEDYE
ncbi:DUF7003 family protein [Rossellomorea sp. H39__3]